VSERVEELYGRWQALQLLSPVFELTKRAAPRAGFDHSRYDLGQLALRAIDQIVVAQASLVGSVSPERLTDHLRGVAQRMAPDDPTRPWQQVATTTLNTPLLRPTRNPAALAPGPRRQALDLPARPARSTKHPGGNHRLGAPVGEGEPPVGLPPHPR